MSRPEWYMATIHRLQQYPTDKKRLEILQARLDSLMPSGTANYSLAPAYSGPGDQTGNAASKRMDIQTEISEIKLRVEEINIVLNSFNFEGKSLIELRFFERYNTDYGVAYKLHMARRTYFRYKDRLIEDVAKMLGYLPND